MTDNIDVDAIADELNRFYTKYRILPPGVCNLIETLAKNPTQYMQFVHILADKYPKAMQALVNDFHGEDIICADGKQCGEYEKDYL